MKKHFLIILFLLLLCDALNAQHKKLVLFNQGKPEKSRILSAKPSNRFTIEYKLDTLANKDYFMSTWKSGIVIENTNTVIKLKQDYAQKVLFYKDSVVDYIDTITINKANIIKLSLVKPITNIYSGIGSAALISALIVSPIVSMKYKSFEFNESKYVAITSVSTLVSMISFSLAFTTMKNYWLENSHKPKRKLWKLE